MKKIPKVKLSDITESKLKGIKDGYKIFDLETQKYYEKVNGQFQEMVEEDKNQPAPEPITDQDMATMIDDLVVKKDDLKAARLLMDLKRTKSDLMAQKDMVNQKINFMFKGTAEQIDLIQARVSEVTEQAIKKAPYEELKQFFVFEGEEVELNYDEMLSDKEKKDAYREFLLYLKSVSDADSEINTELTKIDDLISHFDPEMVKKSEDVYVWDEYVYNLFNERANDPSIDEKERARIRRIIEVRESAVTLEPIIEALKDEISAGRRSSLLYAFKNRFDDTLKSAEKYANQNGFRIYFEMYDNIESKIGISDWSNIFIYLFARYIKYNRSRMSKIDNAFIAQVVQNLIMLKKDQLKEPARTKFANGIRQIIAILSGT